MNDLAVLLAYAAGALVIGGVVVFGALWIIRNDRRGGDRGRRDGRLCRPRPKRMGNYIFDSPIIPG